jgi:2-amino-4-hydroxy-6-hydroxymethyldihydropteridine diphosphokinase
VTRVVLSLGSNVGDRVAALRSALAALPVPGGLRVIAVSPVYETVPVGGPPQPDYLNAVLVADTDLAPHALLAHARAVEAAHGRRRPDRRWGPRPLDVDVVAYGELRQTDPDLTLPHPRAHERAFVLAPWADVDPAAELPGQGPVGTEGVRRRDDLALAALR